MRVGIENISGHRVGRDVFPSHVEQAAKIFPVKSHLNPPPRVINNDRSLIFCTFYIQSLLSFPYTFPHFPVFQEGDGLRSIFKYFQNPNPGYGGVLPNSSIIILKDVFQSVLWVCPVQEQIADSEHNIPTIPCTGLRVLLKPASISIQTLSLSTPRCKTTRKFCNSCTIMKHNKRSRPVRPHVPTLFCKGKYNKTKITSHL